MLTLFKVLAIWIGNITSCHYDSHDMFSDMGGSHIISSNCYENNLQFYCFWQSTVDSTFNPYWDIVSLQVTCQMKIVGIDIMIQICKKGNHVVAKYCKCMVRIILGIYRRPIANTYNYMYDYDYHHTSQSPLYSCIPGVPATHYTTIIYTRV